MTKAALEALVNALLAPAQPITANGMHKPSMQKIMDEMYDAQSRGDVLSGVGTSGSRNAGDLVIVIRSGVAVLLNESLFTGVNHYRGDYAGGTTFPSTGGTLSGGIPAAGNRWRLTGTLTIGGTDVYGAGTIIEAAINTPGQTTGNWVKYATQL